MRYGYLVLIREALEEGVEVPLLSFPMNCGFLCDCSSLFIASKAFLVFFFVQISCVLLLTSSNKSNYSFALLSISRLGFFEMDSQFLLICKSQIIF